MKSINPFNLNELKSYNKVSKEKVTQILPKIENAFQKWKTISFADRSKLFRNLSSLLKDNSKKLAEIATMEMGKPIAEAEAEVEKCAWVCSYYADHAENFLQDKVIESDYYSTFISYEALGAILAVMPWNYPYWQVFRFAAPTIMAGNVGVLKHASNVPQCAEAIEQLFLEAGFPKNVFTTLLIESDLVEEVIQSDTIRAISLTGSGKAGAVVSAQASKEIKKSLLELGGSDAFIICEDASIEKAADAAVKGRFQNNGQSCIAAKRFMIQEQVYDEFINLLIQRVEELKVGNPMDEETDIGPLAKQSFVEDIAKQVDKSIEKGATVKIGGEVRGENNQFYVPTILENVQPGMPAFDEELFGPVASCMQFDTIEEAIDLANDSQFGLGGSVWTEDLEQGVNIARKIVTGTVAVNDITKSDPRIPFGGVKQSGFGRELSKEGIMEFVNKKAINVKKA